MSLQSNKISGPFTRYFECKIYRDENTFVALTVKYFQIMHKNIRYSFGRDYFVINKSVAYFGKSNPDSVNRAIFSFVSVAKVHWVFSYNQTIALLII